MPRERDRGEDRLQRKRKRSQSTEGSSSDSSHDRKKVKKERKIKKSKKRRYSSSSSSSDSDDTSRRKRKSKQKKKKSKHKKADKHSEAKDKSKKKSKHKDPPCEGSMVGPVVNKSAGAASAALAKGPMTKEMWEKEQNVVRRVYDPDTGRNRLVKGSGEIVEEIVSREKQRQINKLATQGDGISYSLQTGTLRR